VEADRGRRGRGGGWSGSPGSRWRLAGVSGGRPGSSEAGRGRWIAVEVVPVSPDPIYSSMRPHHQRIY
jgi:hypothetical protein